MRRFRARIRRIFFQILKFLFIFCFFVFFLRIRRIFFPRNRRMSMHFWKTGFPQRIRRIFFEFLHFFEKSKDAPFLGYPIWRIFWKIKDALFWPCENGASFFRTSTEKGASFSQKMKNESPENGASFFASKKMRQIGYPEFGASFSPQNFPKIGLPKK